MTDFFYDATLDFAVAAARAMDAADALNAAVAGMNDPERRARELLDQVAPGKRTEALAKTFEKLKASGSAREDVLAALERGMNRRLAV